jgi:hypothetical protein
VSVGDILLNQKCILTIQDAYCTVQLGEITTYSFGFEWTGIAQTILSTVDPGVAFGYTTIQFVLTSHVNTSITKKTFGRDTYSSGTVHLEVEVKAKL